MGYADFQQQFFAAMSGAGWGMRGRRTAGQAGRLKEGELPVAGEKGAAKFPFAPKPSAAQVTAEKALRDKNPLPLRWMGLDAKQAESAIKQYNPEFTGPQHMNPTGGMTTRNQATAPPRRRQGPADDTTLLTGQDSMGGGTMLGG